jgi:hypothetical protein
MSEYSKRTFINDGYFYILNRDIGESYERFIDRGEYIAQFKPTNQTDLNKYINQSRIWSNMKYDKCVYSKEVENQIIK